jgi:hypothetical protein
VFIDLRPESGVEHSYSTCRPQLFQQPVDVARRNRPRESHELDFADGLERGNLLDRSSDTLPDEDLPVLRLAAKERREIRDRADGAVVKSSLEADPADRCVALRDADAEPYAMARLAQRGESAATASRIATASRTARAAGSGHGTRSLNNTIRFGADSHSSRSNGTGLATNERPQSAADYRSDKSSMLWHCYHHRRVVDVACYVGRVLAWMGNAE